MAKKNNGISIANIVAILGLVIFLVLSYLGQSYMSGGSMIWDILKSSGYTAVAAFLIWFLIKAKGAENDLKKWKILEYLVLVIYILYAVVSIQYSGVIHFFNVNDKKEQVKEFAREDIANVNKMYDEYEKFEYEKLDDIVAHLSNMDMYNNYIPNDLQNFIEDKTITIGDMSSINTYRDDIKKKIDEYKDYKKISDAEFKTILSQINSWSVLNIPATSQKIEKLSKEIAKRLTENSNNVSDYLPVIMVDDNGYYIDGSHKIEFSSEDLNLQYKKAISEPVKLTEFENLSIIGFLSIIGIHLLILFNYIVAYRTKTLPVGRKMNKDGGITL